MARAHTRNARIDGIVFRTQFLLIGSQIGFFQTAFASVAVARFDTLTADTVTSIALGCCDGYWSARLRTQAVCQYGIVGVVILFVQSFQAVAFVADIAFRQDIVGIVFLRVGGGARSRVAFVAAHVFRFVPLATRQHQQAFGVFMETGGCRRYAVAAVAAAVAVFQTEMTAFVRIDKITRRERDHVHHATERIAAVQRGIRTFDNIDLLERVAFDHITSRNRAVGATSCIRFGNAHAVHHHQNAVAVYASDIDTGMTAAVVV